MKRFFKVIASNYHLIIVLLMFLAVFGITLTESLHEDDLVYIKPAVSSAQVWLQFMKWHMMRNNGRTLIHAVVLLLLRNSTTQYIWRVLCSLGMVSMCILIPKSLFKQKGNYRLGVCIGAFLLMTIRQNMLADPVYWLTGWCNYFLPNFLLILTMFLSVKNINSKWLPILSFFGGATMEQTGMMFVGWFVLLALNELINTKKINSNSIVAIILSVVGYLTVILSPGTAARIKLQSTTEQRGVFTDLMIMARRLWIDNLNLYILIFAMLFAACFWLIYFNRKTLKSRVVSITLVATLVALFTANTLLKAYLASNDKIFGREVVFSTGLNFFIMSLWVAYAVLFVGSILYSGIMIYVKLRVFAVPAALILGTGSQFMVSLAGSSAFRVCFPGICCCLIYCVFSIVYAFNEITHAAGRLQCIKNKKYPIKALKVMIIVACIVGCIAHFYFGTYGRSFVSAEDEYKPQPFSSEEMQAFTTRLEELNAEAFAAVETDPDSRYDPMDFSLYH